MAEVKAWKVDRRLECVYINEQPHEVWPIVCDSEDIGIAVVILPHEDRTRKTRRERKELAQLIARLPELLHENAELKSALKTK